MDKPTILRFACLATLMASVGLHGISAQTKPAFEVASIKRNLSNDRQNLRILPDGTFISTNTPLDMIIRIFVFPTDVVGLPDWVMNERYDIVAKPLKGAPADQQNDRLRSLFAERMKLAAHVEDREQDTFALVWLRSDRQQGPQLKPSVLDCTPGGRGHFTNAPPGRTPTMDDMQARCGITQAPGRTVSGGTTIDRLAIWLRGAVGRVVIDRTGLQGNYSWSLQYAPPQLQPDAVQIDAPDIFTALQEQLGLKLQAEKNKVPFFVIDHIERPTSD